MVGDVGGSLQLNDAGFLCNRKVYKLRVCVYITMKIGFDALKDMKVGDIQKIVLAMKKKKVVRKVLKSNTTYPRLEVYY